MRRLFLVRHGETDWNVQRLLQGASDIPLNDNGRAQARAAAPELTRIAPVTRIVSSDLSRAVETAGILADAMGARASDVGTPRAEVVVDARLRERSYGIWEGMPEDVRVADHPEEHSRWVSGLEPRVEGYEDNASVRDRAVAAIDELTATPGIHVLVSHGSTIRVATGALLGLELGSHAVGNLGNAQWVELSREGDGPWVLRSHNASSVQNGTPRARLVLVRHARTGFNAEGRLQGSLDVPLGPDGMEQAARVAERVVGEYGTGKLGATLAVASSPLQRATGTADAIAALAGTVTRVDARFTQRPYGAWEGLTWEEVRAAWPAEYAVRHQGLDPAIPGWGASDDVADRVAAGLREAAADAARTGFDTVVIVSHGSAIMLGVARLVGLPLTPSRLGHLANGEWNQLGWTGGDRWRLERYCAGS